MANPFGILGHFCLQHPKTREESLFLNMAIMPRHGSFFCNWEMQQKFRHLFFFSSKILYIWIQQHIDMRVQPGECLWRQEMSYSSRVWWPAGHCLWSSCLIGSIMLHVIGGTTQLITPRLGHDQNKIFLMPVVPKTVFHINHDTSHQWYKPTGFLKTCLFRSGDDLDDQDHHDHDP